MVYFVLMCLCLMFPSNASALQAQNPYETFIPEENWITDFEARLALARILAYHDHTLDESLKEYRIILKQKPGNRPVHLEMARVLIRKGDAKEALSILGSIQAMRPNDPETLVALADLEASLGHAERSHNLYMDAIRVSDQPEIMKLKFADRMNMWGEFYQAEAIYREHLKTHPHERAVALQLAAVLRSSERYGESEGIYKRLLAESPDSREILMGLAKLKFLEKKFDAAGKFVDRFLKLDPDALEGLLLKADILFLQKQFEEAQGIYSILSKMKCCHVKGLIGMGKVCLEQGENDLAQTYFDKAFEIAPKNLEARFYAAGTEKTTSEDFVNALLEDKTLSPMILDKWARLYGAHGFNKIAIKCYEASLEMDPAYFPSRIGIAEILAIDQQYDPAIKRFEALAQKFPDNRKILIGWARALGWGRRYHESIELYDKIHRIAPSDPVPQMEKARTAVWAKEMDVASEAYEGLLTPPVDRELTRLLRPIAEASGNPGLIDAVYKLADRAEKGSVFQGLEAFSEELEKLRPALSSDTKKQIDSRLIGVYPSFAIQKTAYLENKGKRLVWNKRFAQAMDAYEELLGFTPGNEEAVFDYAQIECALGLCNREAKTYKKLLDMDKHHGLAGKALERVKIRRNPSVKLGQIYWAERGRDGKTEIDRYRTDLGVDVPIDCRFHLNLTGHHWIEHPSFTNESYGADGFTLGVDGTLNPYIKGEAGWTKKIYQDNEFENTDTGYTHLWFNLRDYVEVGLGYDRTDELYNYFGIRQGIQASSWWLSIDSDITRRLEIMGQAKYMSYNDDNDAQHYLLGAGYSFTNHPRIFKIALTGEYRNTQNHDVYQYEDGQLVNIIHPYWTPQDYYAGGITFEWYHDLSKLLFCGSQRHFYDLALTLGTDTESNPSVELRGEWHYEFLNHWTINITGLIHRSKLWDSEGIWADIRYQF
ncbi:MAG: tetratricopeptide repeat protein [Thermodesulfobacteriota bacterium]|nr:tetratricopeptide repeat protein [Thermodesulfobacteriota bacterium]